MCPVGVELASAQYAGSSSPSAVRQRQPRKRFRSERRQPMNPLLERISIDPHVCFGKPCIRGTRIWVSLILDLLASGMTAQQVIAEYPHLVVDDILAAIAYGAEMARERYVDLPEQVTR